MDMSLEDRIRATFPHEIPCKLDHWVKAGRDYADRLDRLAAPEREAVTILFACYGLSREPHYKRAVRASIDVVIRPWYPAAGVSHANA